MQTENTTLVLGGTGKTGRRVAQRLSARGLPVLVASRSGTPAFDWNDPASWAPMLRGIRAAYLAYYPDLALPGAAQTIGEFSKLAVRSGVQRVVLLAGRGEPQALASEQAVRECGAAFSVLRCAFFCQNFSEGLLLEPIRSGEVAFPAGDVTEPFVDADDIADVAVAALTDDAHSGKTYDLTGPRLLTFEEATRHIARATGRDIRYEQLSGEQYRALLSEQMPPEEAALLTELFRELLDGHNAQLGDGVERALGRKPRDFAEFAHHASSAGAWNG